MQDKWMEWLLQRRYGGNARQCQHMLANLARVRDHVLQNAQIAPGNSVLDLGTGDGLIAFGALEQVGDDGTVIFSDISQDALDHCHACAHHLGALDRCQFLRASADDLSQVSDTVVDVVTIRSVLIYMTPKQQVFDECYRILKSGGRLSLFEPINRFSHGSPHLFLGNDVTPIQEIADKVGQVYRQLQPPESDPMLTFDERDLLQYAEQAGFSDIELELRARISPMIWLGGWEALLHTAMNPNAPTLAEVIDQALTPLEAQQFEQYLRPRIETGQGTKRVAQAYLWAAKGAEAQMVAATDNVPQIGRVQ
jgi:ubiquinone/menaquinone biosynthesis C-methylase UbiE